MNFDATAGCQQDQSDDVRAVAAEALLPVASALAAKPPAGLQQLLWDILLQAEELSPSTGLSTQHACCAQMLPGSMLCNKYSIFCSRVGAVSPI